MEYGQYIQFMQDLDKEYEKLIAVQKKINRKLLIMTVVVGLQLIAFAAQLITMIIQVKS